MPIVDKPLWLDPVQLCEQLDYAIVFIGKHGGRRYSIEEENMSLNTLYSRSLAALKETPQPDKMRNTFLTKLNALDTQGNQQLKEATFWQRLLTLFKSYLTLSPFIRAIQKYRLRHVETKEVEASLEKPVERLNLTRIKKTCTRIPKKSVIESIDIKGSMLSKEAFKQMADEAQCLMTAMISSMQRYSTDHPDYKVIRSFKMDCLVQYVILLDSPLSVPFQPLGAEPAQKEQFQTKLIKVLEIKKRLETETSPST